MKTKAFVLALVLSVLAMFQPSARAQQCSSHQAGSFDFYLLTLSWSPEYCFSRAHQSSAECQQHKGFVLHGLWPQNQNGSYPCACNTNSAGLANYSSTLDIYTDAGLARHEWQQHGACSGLSPQSYFNAARTALQSLHIPQQLQQPTRQQWSSPTQVKQWFVAANPGLSTQNLSIQCRKGFLTGVEACLDKNLHPIACHVSEDCTDQQLKIAPIR